MAAVEVSGVCSMGLADPYLAGPCKCLDVLAVFTNASSVHIPFGPRPGTAPRTPCTDTPLVSEAVDGLAIDCTDFGN